MVMLETVNTEINTGTHTMSNKTLDAPIFENVTDWIHRTETWTRTGDLTFTVTGNLTSIYKKGIKVRYKDGGNYEYGVIAINSTYSSPNTTVTLLGNNLYAMAAATITDTYISHVDRPEGFPDAFTYTPTATGFSGTPTIEIAEWRVVGNIIFIRVGVTGTSNATNFILTSPANLVVSRVSCQAVRGRNAGTYNMMMSRIDTNNSNLTFYTTFAGGGWTNSGTKTIEEAIIFCEL